MKKVVIVQRITGDYRIPFFERLFDILKNSNISIKVVYGQPEPGENIIGSFYNNRNIILINNYYLRVRSKYLTFQFPLRSIFTSDLVILQQGNRIISNHFYLFFLLILGKKVAIWGNCKQEIASFNNHSFKKGWWWKLSKKVDHWFAYNDLTKKIVVSTGYPQEKVTAIYNSIDTNTESAIYNSLTAEEIEILRVKYMLKNSDIVGIFCSRLYTDKKIDFLLQTVSVVKEAIPNFKFFVLGDGIEETKVYKFAINNASWFFQVGSKYGKDKISYFKISDFQLLPGAVGLHIVDSFALETPIITTESTTHGVEIDYLKNLDNGIITENDLKSYSDMIIKVCNDNKLRIHLKKGCNESSEVYSIEHMAEHFANGIIQTLENE